MIKINDYLIKKEDDRFCCYHLFKGIALPFAVYRSLSRALYVVICVLHERSVNPCES
jgi:hypothetical protein